MTASRPLKTIVVLFVAALLFYVLAYVGIEHRRTKDGPWTVAFTGVAGYGVVLRIDQPALGITNVQIQIPAAALATNLNETIVRFDRPHHVPYPLPFGDCVFMDTTFQPGTVVIRAAGHEIQLLPRVLTIDGIESPWKPGQVVDVPAANATNATDAVSGRDSGRDSK